MAYHTFCESVIKRATEPVAFFPLALSLLRGYTETHKDGSNQFIYSRFLVPYLMNWGGWAMYADGDMACLDDITKLWKLRESFKAVMVAKHDYKTKAARKYLGAENQDYPRKNWSSLILWNCNHYANRKLTPDYVQAASGAHLHRFQWLADDQVGEIPLEWNWLAEEYKHKQDVSLVHYTLGTPCFPDYAACDYSAEWHAERKRMNGHA